MTTPESTQAPPKITEVETHGVEPIPDAERTARPLDLFRLTFGGANTIATVVLGIAGSFLAGVIGQFLGWYQAGEGAGFIASVIVAVLLLAVYGKLRGGQSAK